MRKPKAPEANRARIVAAAIDEFAARGFKGASMDAIAARTHTTRALINYYFGSKEKLYLAVLEHVYAEIREAEGQLDLDHLPPVDAMRRIVEFTYNYYIEPRGLRAPGGGGEPGEGPPPAASRRRCARSTGRSSTAWRGSSRAARPRAASARGVDPVDVHMAIAALGMFNVTNQYTFGSIFQRDMGAKGDVAAPARTWSTELILSYLTRT